MRVAALYDIHGNLPGLEAVLRDVRAASVDHIVVGGDVLPGPMPSECLALLRALEIPATFIIGNGDRATRDWRHGIIDAHIPEVVHPAMLWNAGQLTDEDDAVIAGWPLIVRMSVPPIGEVVFCHATPRNDHEIFTVRTDASRLAPIFDPLRADLVVCGHTHMQFDRQVGATRIVNAGSVGMPIGQRGAEWLLLDGSVRLRRTEYDVERGAERVRATAYPHREHFASQSMLAPPSVEMMLTVFGKSEIA